MWILPPSIERCLSLQSHSSPPFQVQSCTGAELCDPYRGCHQSISRPRRWSHSGWLYWSMTNGQARAKKYCNILFSSLCLRYFCGNVNNDDSKEYDMITKAFVKICQNWISGGLMPSAGSRGKRCWGEDTSRLINPPNPFNIQKISLKLNAHKIFQR